MKYRFYKATCIPIRTFKANDSLQFLAHRKILLKAYVQVLLSTLSDLNLKSLFEPNKIFVCDSGKKKNSNMCTQAFVHKHSAQDRVFTGNVIFKKDASSELLFWRQYYFPSFCCLHICILLSHLNYATRFTLKNVI